MIILSTVYRNYTVMVLLGDCDFDQVFLVKNQLGQGFLGNDILGFMDLIKMMFLVIEVLILVEMVNV